MKTSRVVALVIGCLLVLPAIAMLIGGASLLVASAVGRDDGYFETSVERLESTTVAIASEDVDLAVDPGSPDWVDTLDVDVRLRVRSAASDGEVFVGIARQADIDAYLAGVAHDVVVDFEDDEPRYRRRSGDDQIEPPGDQGFWAVSASGLGTQEVEWEATGGRWAAVVMNADGSPGVAVDADIGVDPGFLIPLAVILLAAGAVLTAGAVALIVLGATGLRTAATAPGPAGVAGAPVSPAATAAGEQGPSPVRLEARLDADLSRWLWLVKWFLAIPHLIVLAFLWIAFIVLTVVAGFAILFTGRYPRGIFDFNVGVLRWSWRVGYYATTGGLGTDRYPPFSLGAEPDYPATLDVAEPGELSRGLVLVKWWLLAIPHYLVVGVLVSGTIGWTDGDDAGTGGMGLLGLLVLIAAVVLLFRGRYPRPLFDLVVGLNRWIYRVVAYAALMTDQYPPFRLDQGGEEPVPTMPTEPTEPEVPPAPGAGSPQP